MLNKERNKDLGFNPPASPKHNNRLPMAGSLGRKQSSKPCQLSWYKYW